jgi:hypothetical protein
VSDNDSNRAQQIRSPNATEAFAGGDSVCTTVQKGKKTCTRRVWGERRFILPSFGFRVQGLLFRVYCVGFRV